MCTLLDMSGLNLTSAHPCLLQQNTSNTSIPTRTTKAFIGVALESIVLMTIGGNILVLLAVFVNRKLRTTTNYFVVSLAVADLFLGTLVIPFSAIRQMEQQWIFGTVFCDIWAAVDVLCCTASILSLCAISIDRYIGVTRPLQHRNIMSSKRTIGIIVSIWALSFAISLGPLIGWRDKKTDPNICNVTDEAGYVIFSSLMSFYIPAMVIIGIYSKIYKEAKAQAEFLKTGFKTSKVKNSPNGTHIPAMTLRAVSRKNLYSQSSQASFTSATMERQHSVDLPLSAPVSPLNRQLSEEPFPEVIRASTDSLDSISPKPNKPTGTNKLKRLGKQLILGSKIAKFNKERKAAKTLGIVVGVFLMCWCPFFLILPLDSLCTRCTIPSELFDIVFWLGYCNSMLNPIIYATWNREFKYTFTQILKCKFRRKQRRKKAVGYLARVSAQHMAQAASGKKISVKAAPRKYPLKWNISASSLSNYSIDSAELLDEDDTSMPNPSQQRFIFKFPTRRKQNPNGSIKTASSIHVLQTINDTEDLDIPAQKSTCCQESHSQVDGQPFETEPLLNKPTHFGNGTILQSNQ